MRRLHAIEFEDFPWFPSTLRDAMTDFFRFQMTRFNLYSPALDILAQLLKETEQQHIVDLCSGGGGPWQALHPALIRYHCTDLRLTLTDKYPNSDAFRNIQQINTDQIDYSTTSVDATQVPANLSGVRTLFSSFHHFRPKQARAILQNAIDQNQAIALFELSNRSFASFFNVTVAGPISYLLLAPFIKPVRPINLLFTYIVPIIPFLLLWDGWGSNLRAYSSSELKQLVAGCQNQDRFDWQTGTHKGSIPGAQVTFLVGKPKKNRR